MILYKKSIVFIFAMYSMWIAKVGQTQEFILPPGDVDLIGELQEITANQEDALIDIARRHGLGYNEIVNANPKVDPWLPKKGTKIILPTQYILPRAPREGIIVNSPEMRLYYFPPTTPGMPQKVVTYPVAVGRVDWNTPLGITKIVTKQIDPVWRPPASIRKEAIENGTPLPEVVPAGPNNPLGRFAMRLGLSGSYLIHGTDKLFGIGMQVTHGCMRLYPEDIESLFKQVPINTKVNLINQPVKLGWLAGILFAEITQPLEQDAHIQEKLQQVVLEIIKDESDRRKFKVKAAMIKKAIAAQSGIPVAISHIE